MAKAAAVQQTVDPAALGALIPMDGDGDTLVTLGDEAPPLLRHEPMPPPASQSPGQLQKARRVSATAPATAAPAQPRKDIARMMPSSHRVYVYKKKEDGKQTFINEYTAQELQGAGTIEAFIKKYVVPHYEHGEYHVHYFDGQGKEPTPLGSVNIEAPVDYVPPQRANVQKQQTAAESLREAMALQKEIQQQMLAQQPPPKSQSETLMETMMASMIERQMKSLSSGDQQKDGGMGTMLLMMMMERMKPAAAPTIDPGIQRLMEKMADRIEAMEQEMRVSAAMVPPPPMPVSEGPSHLDVILETMRENTRMMVEAMKSQQVNRDPIKDLADMAQLMAPKNESLTTKDLFELMPKFQMMFAPQNQQKDPFEKTIENFKLFKMMQREFGDDRPQQQAAPEDNFWAFARDMIRGDIGKSIAAQIVAQTTGQDIAQHPRQRAAQQQEQARMVAQRRAQQAAQQRQLAEARALQLSQEASRAAQSEQQKVAAAPIQEATQPATEQSASPPPAPPPQEPHQPTQEPQQQVAEEEEEGQEVHVPDDFLNIHAKAINEAAEEPQRVEAIITGFQNLATSTDFRPVITKMFGLCKLNRKLEALDHLVEILEFFSENEVLNQDVPQLSRDAFDKHWKIIRQMLNFPDVPEVAPPVEQQQSGSAA